MSGVQKAPSLDLKPPDKGGEQPMDLAPRASHIAKPVQQATAIGPTLRPHLDAAKSAFTTLGQRVSSSPRPVIQLPLTVASTGGVNTSVTQPYTIKSGPAVSQLSTLRHMVSSSTGGITLNANTMASPMASIIRGSTITTTQIGHTVSHQYSSHVPRGPAAVASINTAPKSALATPMLRSSMGQVTTTSHIPVGARSSGLVPARTSFTPVPRSALSMAQVMDLQKSGSHGGGPVQIGLSSGRPLEPLPRSTLGHLPVAISKPLHMTQPIVHSLHQVTDKGFKCGASPATVQYTTMPGLSAGITTHSPVVTSATSPLTTSCGPTVLSAHQQVVQPAAPVRSNLATMSLVTLAPTVVAQSAPQVVPVTQPSPLPHGLVKGPGTTAPPLSGSPGGLHPIYTVMPGKGVSPSPPAPTTSSHVPAALVLGQGRLGSHMTSNVTTTSLQTTSIQVAAAASRPITTTVSIQPPSVSVPAAKVFSQAPMVHGPSLESSSSEPTSAGNLFVGQPTSRSLAAAMSSSAAVSSTAASLPATVVISESRTDRPAQLSAAPYATYLYEQYPIQGTTLSMHPYATTGAGVTPVFPATSVRPTRPQLGGPPGPPCTTTVVQPPPLGAGTVRGPLMVAVDSGNRHQAPPHVTLHTPFTPNAGLVGHGTSSVTDGTSTTLASSVVPSPYNCMATSNLLSPTHSATPTNHNTSPRPSILRKRTFEGVHINVKKNLMASLPGSEPASPRSEAPASLSTTSSPKPASDLQHESSNSSSTASEPVTAEVTKSSLPPVTIKQEPQEISEVPANGNSASLPIPSTAVEASPRKKPRKQLLLANKLLDTHSTDGDDDLERESRENLRRELPRSEDVKCVAFCKRPSMSLLTSYSHSWKTRQNHFARHTDVKPKDDKKQTVNDLANQKGVLQKANGWKVFHLTSQMEEVYFLEDTVHTKLSELLDFIEEKPPAIQTKPLNVDEERILSKINDLIKGNLQRSKIVQDQVTEAKQQVLKVLEHKPRIVEIIGKYVSKRPLKKREKM
ncbi:histone deacetylase complex subunit SAP130 [Ixodes scapularis]|nr:histone deacetylase complex subunit SAP130 [Ixodes scapularis]